MTAPIVTSKDPSEVVTLSFDFTVPLLTAAIKNIVGVTVVVDSSTERPAADVSPSSTLNGTANFSGAVVFQSFSGGVAGVNYKVSAEIVTNENPARTLELSMIVPVRVQ